MSKKSEHRYLSKKKIMIAIVIFVAVAFQVFFKGFGLEVSSLVSSFYYHKEIFDKNTRAKNKSDAQHKGGLFVTNDGSSQHLDVDAYEQNYHQENINVADINVNLPDDAKILPQTQVVLNGKKIDIVDRELLVKFKPQVSSSKKQSVISSVSAKIEKEDSITGYSVLRLPKDLPIMKAKEILSKSSYIETVRPNVMMKSAGTLCKTESSYAKYQWHVDVTRQDEVCSIYGDAKNSVIVAVLDSGVAYENYQKYKQAESLSRIPVVAPMDFINNDTHANDDNQHGTHIATTILGAGATRGIALGMTLMPVKILDAMSQGTELSLSQGIRWATDNNAQIINLSVSFPPYYVPSSIVQDAISYAVSKGVLIISAAGNNGVSSVSYPAAFRDVISVGSASLVSSSENVSYRRSNYSNYGPGLDLVTTGGDLSLDANMDGYPDGILSETIAYQNPASLGYYFYEGTSQAAAVASGVAAWIMSSGLTAEETKADLLSSVDDIGEIGYDVNFGQGFLSLLSAYEKIKDDTSLPSLFTNITPVIFSNSEYEWATARVEVVTENGTPVSGAKIFATWSGTYSQISTAVTDSKGIAFLKSPETLLSSSSGVFIVEIGAVADPKTGLRVKPHDFYYISPYMSEVLDSSLSESNTAESFFLFEVQEENYALKDLYDLEHDIIPCFVVKSIGTSIPLIAKSSVISSEILLSSSSSAILLAENNIPFEKPLYFNDIITHSGIVSVYELGSGAACSQLGFSETSTEDSDKVSSVSSTEIDSCMISGKCFDGKSEISLPIVYSMPSENFSSKNSAIDQTLKEKLLKTRYAVNSSELSSVEDNVITNIITSSISGSLVAEEAKSFASSLDGVEFLP